MKFLKFGNTVRPFENLCEICLYYQDDIQYIGDIPIKRGKKLTLQLKFNDGSSWAFDLPKEMDREIFIQKFVKEMNKVLIFDVPKTIEKILQKEVRG